MEIEDLIANAVTEDEEFDKLCYRINTSKKINRKDYSTLVQLLEKDTPKILEKENLAHKVILVIAKALKNTKISDANGCVRAIINSSSRKVSFYMHAILMKRCNVERELLAAYIKKMRENEMYLCHWKVLFAISKFYSALVDKEFIDFCRGKECPIAKEIVKSYAIEECS